MLERTHAEPVDKGVRASPAIVDPETRQQLCLIMFAIDDCWSVFEYSDRSWVATILLEVHDESGRRATWHQIQHETWQIDLQEWHARRRGIGKDLPPDAFAFMRAAFEMKPIHLDSIVDIRYSERFLGAEARSAETAGG